MVTQTITRVSATVFRLALAGTTILSALLYASNKIWKQLDKLRNFINEYHLNLFNDKWTSSEINLFNKAVLSGTTNTKQISTLVCEKIAQDLNKSKVSNNDILKLLGIKNSKRTREDLCRQIIKNIVNTGQPKGNINSKNNETAEVN